MVYLYWRKVKKREEKSGATTIHNGLPIDFCQNVECGMTGMLASTCFLRTQKLEGKIRRTNGVYSQWRKIFGGLDSQVAKR